MDDDLRHHLTEVLTRVRSIMAMAERSGVPRQVAERLRAAASEIEAALDSEAAGRSGSVEHGSGGDNMEIIARWERERGVWGLDEA